MTFKTKPFPHQERIFNASKDLTAVALFMEMGTGKSKVLIDTACHLWTEGKINLFAVVCPKGVMPSWVNELAAHTWDSVPTRVVAGRAESLARAHGGEVGLLQSSHALRVLLFPVSLLSHKSGVTYLAKLLTTGASLLAIDESTSIKNHKSLRTKACLGWAENRRTRTKAFCGLGKLATYRRIATGMPVTQTPLDLWSQCEFLDRSFLSVGGYFGFRSQYANIVQQHAGHRSYSKIVGYRSLDLLSKRLDTFSYRVTKAEVLPDLPAKTFALRQVDMTPEQARMYKDMRRDAVASWPCGSVVSAPITLTQILRMREVLCGFSRADDGTILPVPSNRLTVLVDVLSEVSEKAIIWCPHTWAIRDIESRVAEEFGAASVVSYYGATDDQARASAVLRFQTDPTCRFFLANPATGGEGLTLTSATTVIYYANGPSVSSRAQSEDRAHRIGQKNAVLYIDLVCAGTVDEKMLMGLRDKRSLSDLVMNGRLEDVI